MLTDIEIAQATTPQHISEIAEKAGVPESYLEMYGTNKAKVDYNLLKDEAVSYTHLDVYKRQILRFVRMPPNVTMQDWGM